MANQDEQYIGDGVYASTDGYQIWLRTTTYGGENLIALEPAVFDALIRYREWLSARVASEQTPLAAPEPR